MSVRDDVATKGSRYITIGEYASDKRQTIRVRNSVLGTESVLYDGIPSCQHSVGHRDGGGVECKKCGGWFCY